MHRFNYREIRTPVFEETALFARGIGELTDIVKKEMYTFQDRGGTMLTLKPEMTAAVMRSYLQHNMGERKPLIKVYYIAPMFRQERPQAGRLRQFHQFGAEAIGGSNPFVDAEIIALSAEVYRVLEVKNFQIKINSVGCLNCRPIYKEILKKNLHSVFEHLSEDSKRRFEQNPLRILDSKDENDQKLTKNVPLIKDYLCKECSAHFIELQSTLRSLNIEFEIDGRIVRGLDYYTKTAFEIISKDLGSQDALVGGGRYDLLLKELGGKPTPSVGFAAGVERLLLTMEKQQLFAGVNNKPKVFIAAVDEEGRRYAMVQAIMLRRNNIPCEVDLLGRSLKSQMREADRQEVEFVIIIGGHELEKEIVIIKNMKNGIQTNLAAKDLIGYFQETEEKIETGGIR